MSRRKQARPIRVLEEGELLPPSQSNGDSGSGSEDETQSGMVVCPHCSSEFSGYADLAEHGKDCIKGMTDAAISVAGASADEDAGDTEADMAPSSPAPTTSVQSDDEGEYDGEKRQEEERRHRQDAENNNSVEEDDSDMPFPLGHVTLEALQNTKVAVAQFAATAMANNADNPAALQELAVLQSTLYTLQHQQMMQLNLIQQLQQQLQITRPKEGSPSSPPPRSGPSRTPTPVRQDVPPTPPSSQSLPASHTPVPPKPEPSPPIPPVSSLPPCSISSSFASSIITNLDPPPSPSEPNTLEMLQKRAQEVLDNASQGLLASNLADELAFRKNGGKGSLSPYDSKTGGRNEPFFKHRCRYCGKVFGSDSALQIHIRSHTGERPFKCNVCGSRFTTKGNLKVHFQRHSAKFPHIKMNPNPVPEHLDKFHPPLIAQMQAHQSLPPGPHPGGFPGGPQFPSGLPMYRPPPAPHDLLLTPHSRPILEPLTSKPILPLPQFGPQEMPENLSKGSSPDRFKSEPRSDDPAEDGRLSPKKEPTENADSEHERYLSPPPYDDCSLDSSKYTVDDVPGDRDSPGVEKNDDSLQDQPENLSNKSTSDVGLLSLTPDHRLPPPSHHYPDIVSPPSSTSSGSVHRGFHPSSHDPDPIKDPAVYSSLLPRPGSNDNSWESLIEITKTSETHKLQLMVDNIENKMIDPNQCIICHRVLSCKSALQMHYRTHTGERPFRCKICGRAFTTKGNLKTHMGVHRIKPPMRMLHQCPVCHKKFTNGLVLQQHIRLHTGEPTDLTPEQIQAAEIRDFAPTTPEPQLRPFTFPQHQPPPPQDHQPLTPHLDNQSHRPPSASSSPRPSRTPNSFPSKEEDKPDYLEDTRASSVSPISDAAFSTSITALENQVRTITTVSSHYLPSKYASDSYEDYPSNQDLNPLTVNGEKSPGSRAGADSPSGSEGHPLASSPPHTSSSLSFHHMPRQPTSPSIASETSSSLGALDLTPRPGGPPPHPGLFSGFGIMPPGSIASSSPLMTSALSSLTSSVLTTTAFNPLGLAVGPPGKLPGRGNTTCNLCFKTFACNSALEIHYRSHTKERPFKCTICDRGFSTKGNMKQHMLTHKIRDMPAHLFEQKVGSGGAVIPGGPAATGSSPSTISSSAGIPAGVVTGSQSLASVPTSLATACVQPPPPPPPPPPLSQQQVPPPPTQQLLPSTLTQSSSLHQRERTPPSQHQLSVALSQQQQTEDQRSGDENSMPSMPVPPPPPQVTLPPSQPPPQSQPLPPQAVKPELGVKRSPPQSDATAMPLPKRAPSLPKHLCHVCNKNFSSSSALQIHMRTHTGDKPFRCSICLKAFTTKGNLKVHMGTHMWTNGASRRGRRMSLELPPLPKDSDFLHRRPDLFYPYLPAPFLNGIHQKLSEFPIGGGGGGGGGGGPPPNGMMNFGGFSNDLKSEPRSPPDKSGGGGQSVTSPPSSLWDIHLKQSNHHGRSSEDSSPPPPSMPPPRGEGLAA